LLESAQRNIFEHGLVSTERGSISNPAAHSARADHGNGAYFHAFVRSIAKDNRQLQ
jgi:hypothetical protein